MDKETYVQQMEAYSSMMYRIALTILRNDEDCKDAMQDTALKAWEKRGSLRDEQHFSTWMTRILINECYNIQRKRRRTVLVADIPDVPVPAQDITVRVILESLPEKYRLPLVLKFSEGMNDAEIAKVLHLPQSTVRGRIFRGKQRLRKELEA